MESDNSGDNSGDNNDPVDDDRLAAIKFLAGNCVYVVGHPEHLTHTSVKKVFQSHIWRKRVSHLVVDEAHCVLQYGKSQFRPAYLALKSLRATLQGAKILALTATATPTSIKEITKMLALVDVSTISLAPDRPNLFLQVRTRPPITGGEHTGENSVGSVIHPLLRQLKEEKKEFPKTVIYMPLHWCGWSHEIARLDYQIDSDVPDIDYESDELPLYICQYHAPQTNEMKCLITKSMGKADSKLRLLFATEAYGMGTNAPNIRQIYHIGPPNTIETFIQEIGRAGRDKQPATSTLYFNASDIGKNKDHLTDEMRDYCRLESCRREFVMNYFGFKNENVKPAHACCDNCAQNCKCVSCVQAEMDVDEGDEVDVISTVSKEISQIAEVMLMQYFTSENSCKTEYSLPEMITGLSNSLAKHLAKHASFYANQELLRGDYPHLDKHDYIENIALILEACVN